MSSTPFDLSNFLPSARQEEELYDEITRVFNYLLNGYYDTGRVYQDPASSTTVLGSYTRKPLKDEDDNDIVLGNNQWQKISDREIRIYSTGSSVVDSLITGELITVGDKVAYTLTSGSITRDAGTNTYTLNVIETGVPSAVDTTEDISVIKGDYYHSYKGHLDRTLDFFNVQGEGFDLREFLRIVDSLNYGELLFGGIAAETLGHLLPRIYNMKGTERGLQLILKLFRLNMDIYSVFELRRSYNSDRVLWDEFVNLFGNRDDDLLNCEVYFHLKSIDQSTDEFRTFAPGSVDVTSLTVQELVAEVLRNFLWVCAKVIISIRSGVVDSFQISDSISIADPFADDATVDISDGLSGEALETYWYTNSSETVARRISYGEDTTRHYGGSVVYTFTETDRVLV